MKRLGFWIIIRSLRAAMLRYMPLMITCRQFEDFIVEYLEDNLSRKQKLIFEMHIKVCRECRDYLAAYKRTVDVVAQTSAGDKQSEPLPEVPEDLVKAILAARKL